VLVHGLAGSARWWRQVRLPEREVRTVDYRRADPLQLDEPAVVVGHSLGGLLAAQLAAARPELVRALVLVAPVGAPRPVTGYAAGLLGALRLAPPSLLLTVGADALRWGLPALARGAWAATHTVFAGRIEAPTLLVWGARDRLVPPALAESWRSAIPDARLEVVAGAGHVPMLETPERFNELLHDFLDELRV
jgi:pimeloyl-ACP methyl ester carboxylesterase